MLDTLIPREREVQTVDGAWYLARMQPYRTLDDVIAGVVLTFTEVTDFKRASEAVQRSETQLALAQETAHLASWELDVATGQARWSAEMFKIHGFDPATTATSLENVLGALGPADGAELTKGIRASVETRAPLDLEYRVTRPDGTSRIVRSRALPMPDVKGRVTHLVGTSLDITESREAERLRLAVVQQARTLAEGIVNTVREPLLVLDGSLQIVSASRAFYERFRVTEAETLGRRIFELGNGQWDIPALRELLERILPREEAMEGYVVDLAFPDIGRHRMVLNARRIVTASGGTDLILLAMVSVEPVEASP